MRYSEHTIISQNEIRLRTDEYIRLTISGYLTMLVTVIILTFFTNDKIVS